MDIAVVGSIGAAAPEVVRWRQIAKSEIPEEWKRASYWVASALYVALAGFFAFLVARPNYYAAFIAGLTADVAILGVVPRSGGPAGEELSSSHAGLLDAARATIKSHASYLR